MKKIALYLSLALLGLMAWWIATAPMIPGDTFETDGGRPFKDPLWPNTPPRVVR